MSFKIVPSGSKPLTMANSVQFLSDMKGRDKAMRFLQYFARFLTYQLLTADPKSDLGKRLKELYKAVGLHRKAWKLGTFIDEYLKLVEALNDAKDGMKRRIEIAVRAFMVAFIVHDNLVWLMSVKFLDGAQKDQIKLRSYKFRFLAAVGQMALVLLSFAELNEKLAKDSNDVKLQEKQGANVLGIVKNGCDLLTYGTNTEWFPFLNLDDGKMGLLGAVSAVAGGYPSWLKLK